jgi:diguanylate cyclase (GGDEF)-like protein
LDAQDLIRELKKTVDELQVFNELGKTLTSTLEIKEVLKIIMKKVSELLHPSSWALFMLDEFEKELTAEILVGEHLPFIKNNRVSMGLGFVGWVAQSKQAILVPDPTSKKSYTPVLEVLASEPHRSCMCVPLISKEKLLGVMKLVNDGKNDNLFTEQDLGILSTFADYAAIAIENARNFTRVQELTITDDLTTLFNSRYMHTLLDNEFERSRRYHKHFTLIFIDLDHFKQVNDNFNHMRGSQLLREAAVVIKQQLRTVDIATRYGGDEFVLMLPETPKEMGLQVAERIRDAINQHSFLISEGLNVKLTASFGVACFPTDAATKDELIRLADEAMYKVKHSTRNSVATV